MYTSVCGGRSERFSVKETDVIQIYKYTKEELQKKCDEFEEMPYIDACRYCNWPFDVKEVLAGEQL